MGGIGSELSPRSEIISYSLLDYRISVSIRSLNHPAKFLVYSLEHDFVSGLDVEIAGRAARLPVRRSVQFSCPLLHLPRTDLPFENRKRVFELSEMFLESRTYQASTSAGSPRFGFDEKRL